MDPENIMQMLIAYCDPSKPNELITEDSTDVQPDNNSKEAGDSYLCNPIPENEHVGIDEEKMYLENEKDKANVPEDGSEDGSEDESEDGSEDESEDGSEDESEEEPELEEELHEPDHAPNTEYDQQDPPMTVGSTYPNMGIIGTTVRRVTLMTLLQCWLLGNIDYFSCFSYYLLCNYMC
jgi:hypothetical protein